MTEYKCCISLPNTLHPTKQGGNREGQGRGGGGWLLCPITDDINCNPVNHIVTKELTTPR